jgi:hypothetical protein
MSVTISRLQHVVLDLNPLYGTSPGAVASVPTWVVDDPTLCTLVPAVDGLSCDVRAMGGLGPTGTATVTASFTGNGGATVAANFTVVIVAAVADNAFIMNEAPLDLP